MATITLARLPFTDSAPLSYEHEGPLIDWLQVFFPHGFGCAVHFDINGEAIALADLDRELRAGDQCTITAAPGGAEAAGFIIYALISLAVAYVVQRVFAPGLPKAPGTADQPQPNSIYSVSAAQENAARLGEPMPVIYGDVMTTPDLAMQSFYAYTEVFLPVSTPSAGLVVTFYNGSVVTHTQTYVMTAYYCWTANSVNNGNYNWRLYATGSPTPGLIDRNVNLGLDDFTPWVRISPSNTNAQAAGAVFLNENTYVDWMSLTPNGIPPTTITRTLGADGDQYLCQLFCIGLGDHEAITPDRVLIGDTPLLSFAAVNYSLLNAPQSVHQGIQGPITNNFPQVAGVPNFHENVITALAVGNQELTQLNDETQFFPTGNQQINRIAVDILLPRGLYKINTTSGAFVNISVQLHVFIQAQDTGGNWFDVTDRVVIFSNPSIKNVSPWRRSLIFDVSPGVYRVKIRRETAQAPTDGSVADGVQWIGLRGYGMLTIQNQPIGAYGNSHLMALRLKASDVVSSIASTRIRARARRVINIPAAINPANPGVQFTQNPAAHCYDILTNTDYGGRRGDDEFDSVTFSKLFAHWAGANGFNGAFADKITIFEALSSVLQTVAAQPLALNGQISARYEGVKPNRLQLFTDANIVADSLSINYTFDAAGTYDSIRVQYRDPATWTPLFYLYPTKAVYPQDVNLFGCSDTATAVQMATFIYQQRYYQHKSIRFDVELEGNLARPGDRVAVQHAIISPTAGGMLAAYVPGSLYLTVDRPLDFIAGQQHAIILRNPSGAPGETHNVQQVDSRTLLLDSAIQMPLAFANDDNPTLFAFGTTAYVVRDFLMDGATHSGGNVFTIEGTVYDEQAYQGAMPYLTIPVQ